MSFLAVRSGGLTLALAVTLARDLCSVSAWSRTYQIKAKTSPSSFGLFAGVDSPGRHGYDRDPNDFVDGIDTEEVNALIAQRLDCRKTGKYRQADGIQDHLKSEFGVEVNDRGRSWSASPSTSAGRRQAGPPRKRNRSRGTKQDFGPNGHDYHHTGGPINGAVCSLEEREIHALLAERLSAKLDRNYRKADNIQHMLWDKGVRIHDKRREWRADGESFGIDDEGEGHRPRGARERITYTRPDRNKPCMKSPHSQPLSPQDEEYVNARVELRMKAKRNRDYDLADDIRAELLGNRNVVIDDRLRQWSAGGDFGDNKKDFGSDNDYFFVGNEADVDGDVLESITNMLAQRSKAKRARKYKVADSIRDELFRSFGVRVDDKRKSWLFEATTKKSKTTNAADPGNAEGSHARIPWGDDIDGEYSANDEFVVDGSEDSPYFEVKGSYSKSPNSLDLSAEDETYIVGRLVRRVEAWQERDYDTVDAIKAELLLAYDTHINDEEGQWSVGGGFGSDTANEGTVGDVEAPQSLKRASTSPLKSPSSVDTTEELEKLTIPVLKEKLRERGLKLSGRKSDLISRLLLAKSN